MNETENELLRRGFTLFKADDFKTEYRNYEFRIILYEKSGRLTFDVVKISNNDPTPMTDCVILGADFNNIENFLERIKNF